VGKEDSPNKKKAGQPE
jgi:hypothetical protein